MKLSIVIPCYRSVETLPLLVPQLISELSNLVANNSISDFETLLVVDGSPDNTIEIARNYEDLYSQISVLELQRNFGQHNALLAGIRAASGEIIITMDDDLQHPTDQIHKLISPITSGFADLVYGIPEKEEHGFARSLASRTVKRGLKLTGVPNAEWVSAFRAFRTYLREGFSTVNEPTVNLDVLLSWTTTRISAVKVEMNLRERGDSSYSILKLLRHTLNMVTGYGVVPLKFATFIGFAVGILGFVILITELVKYFLGENLVAGFTTTIALVCVFSGAQLITIGLIGEYLGRMHFRTMNKPMYLVRGKE